jgi:imidazolonepropionase
MKTLLTGIGRLWSAGRVLERAAVLLDGPRVAWVGPAPAAPRDADIVEDCGGALLTPGLVDAHTHPVYAGDRFAEIALRSAGASYADIAAAGGGITSTVQATRAASTVDLMATVRERLRSWLTAGTTTVEAKTGYVLTRDGELDTVRLLRSLAGEPGLPRLSVTFLAAHAVPPGWPGTRRGYADAVASWCPAAASAGADNVDVFCDEGYFTVEEARTVLRAGIAAGLVPRVHADELAHTGGARLAAQLGCASADHLLAVTAEDAAGLAAADVAAVLCPGTALQLRLAPPVGLLRTAGVTLALGSDHNPGQCGITSMSLVAALAVAALGLSVDEALLAATVGGARSLRLADRGAVSPGMLADLVLWDAEHEGAFAWAFGLRPRRVWRGGEPVQPTP